MNILVTGSNGFIGRNLMAVIGGREDVCVFPFDVDHPPEDLERGLRSADLIFHLAGVNRPKTEEEFLAGNVDLTRQISSGILALGRSIPIVFSSSVQAALDNPYGLSKRRAEETLEDYAEESKAHVVIYRLKNVFGKWCRPDYNSVVATFCHHIAHDEPIVISDENREVELVYIDDVVRSFVQEIEGMQGRKATEYREIVPVYKVTLGKLAELIRSFRELRRTLYMPDFGDRFTRILYGTFVSYLDPKDLVYGLDQKRDPRGSLAEFIKSPSAGQVFASRTRPGVTRGNHYHHTKAEKFLVVEGEAIIRFKHIRGGPIVEYRVRGEDFRVVDIPPGYTHSIENVGQCDLVTLFWADELFDSAQPDTYFMPVLSQDRAAIQ